MKKRNNLGVVLHILEILKTNTDSEHLITQKEIEQKLKVRGLNCKRYSIERNIETLRNFGYDVVTIKGTGTFLKNNGLNVNDVFVLLEAINRAELALETNYIKTIQDKLLKSLNVYEIEELKNKNMIV